MVQRNYTLQEIIEAVRGESSKAHDRAMEWRRHYGEDDAYKGLLMHYEKLSAAFKLLEDPSYDYNP